MATKVETSPSVPPPSEVNKAEIEAYIARPNFNHEFQYQSQVAGKELTVSYSIVGVQHHHAPTYMYLGGIFGGRFHGLWVDYLCKQKGVRGIFPDRPGLGHFTSVPLKQRVDVLTEVIPHILKDANIDRFCLMALSGGVIYALNILWHHTTLVQTEHPIFLLSPWVTPSKSEVAIHIRLSYVPAFTARGIGRLGTYVLKQFLSYLPQKDFANKQFAKQAYNVSDTCGTTPTGLEEQRSIFRSRLFLENTTGAAEDYLMGIKDPRNTWGICADYEDFARKLVDRCQKDGLKLRLQALFAANDVFIGSKGINYFDKAFAQAAAADGAGLEYTSSIVQDVTHEGIALPEAGIVGRLMDEIIAESRSITSES